MPKPGEKMPEAQKVKIREALKARGLSPTKNCPRCNVVKDRGEFGLRSNGYSRARCRPCEVEAYAAYRAKKGPATAKSRRALLARWHGMTEEDYQSILARQGGGCAICGTTEGSIGKRLFVDHCHDSGLIRGLLCSPCNVGIGMLKDDPARMAAAIKYVTAGPGPDARYVRESERR